MITEKSRPASGEAQNGALTRRLTLPLLTLYGLGVTIGAGIYVLVGLTAAKAGFYAPVSFLIAALVVAFTGFSYAELATRFPVSAGEAAYVRNGFNSSTLALIVGMMVAASGIVSSAAIAIGASAYLSNFTDLSPMIITVLVILFLGVASAWGILESVSMAAIFTLIEIGGLFYVVFTGVSITPDFLEMLTRLVPPFELDAWAGITAAGLLAFFAFVGFEDIANVAEEVIEPRKNMPRAIILTLVIATLVYLVVVSVVVIAVPMEKLRISAAPLALIFEGSGGTARGIFNLIATVATLNGVLIQMIMASRVLYGMACQGNLPRALAYVHPRRRTPLVATFVVVTIILLLALFLPIGDLAIVTSQIALAVFMMVNLALLKLKLKLKGTPPSLDVFQIPLWVPVLGFLSCMFLLLSGIL
jgi:APA family basic amino acid/polyamine antiporter